MGLLLSKISKCDKDTHIKQGQECRVLAKQSIPKEPPYGADCDFVTEVNFNGEKKLKEKNEANEESPFVAVINHKLGEQESRLRWDCKSLKWMPKTSIPKRVHLDGTSLFIRLHMDLNGSVPYNPVNMFIFLILGTEDSYYWFNLSEDFAFHLPKIFIQNLFHRARPVWQIYDTTKVFIENLHKSYLPCNLLGGITSMFLKELFDSNIGTNMVINITKFFLEHLMCEKLSSFRTSCLGARFGKQLFGGELGENLTMRITGLFTNTLNRCTHDPWKYSKLIQSLFQGLCKSKHNQKYLLKVAKVVTDSILYANKEVFAELPGLKTICKVSIPEDITIKIAKMYANTMLSHSDKEVIRKANRTFLYHLFDNWVKLGEKPIIKIINKYMNMLRAHPDKKLVVDLAWSYSFRIFDYEDLSEELKTKMAILAIKKMLRMGSLTNDQISDIFEDFSYLLYDLDKRLSTVATFDITYVFISHLFNSRLPDDHIFHITKAFLREFFIYLSTYQSMAFDIAAMFIKTLFESNLSEEASMRIVDDFTYRLCDGNLPSDIGSGYIRSGTINPVDPSITFDIATIFMEKLHEARLPEELQIKFINLLLVNLGLNALPEELAFDIATMILEYLNKTQLSEELIEKASKIRVSAAVQKCAMLSFGRLDSRQKSRRFLDGPRVMTSQQIYRATVAEVDLDIGRNRWNSDDEEEDEICQDDESTNELVNPRGILSNTVFNMTD